MIKLLPRHISNKLITILSFSLFFISPFIVTPAFAAPTVTEYPVPTTNANPYNIVMAPNGLSMWFTELSGGKIANIDNDGNITEYTIPPTDPNNPQPTFPFDIVIGHDNNSLWFTEEGDNNVVGKITLTGQVTLYHIPTPDAGPKYITGASTNGSFWFTENRANQIGAVDTSGNIHEYPIPTPNSNPEDIVEGPDNALWFVQQNTNEIGRMDYNGNFSEYPLPTPNSYPSTITNGPDGALWFTIQSDNNIGNQIGRLDPSNGNVTVYPLPAIDNAPFTIVTGSDGALWFTNDGDNDHQVIGRMTTSGDVTNYPVSTPNASLTGLATNSYLNLWFVEFNANKIGQITVPPAGPTNLTIPSPTDKPVLTWNSAPNASTYNIYANNTLIGRANATTFTDNNPTPGTDTYYVTANIPGREESEPSNTVTVQVNATAAITSANSYTANVRSSINFQVTTDNFPTTPAITESGALPNGVTFTDNGDGTATIAGIPAADSNSSYPVTITADSGAGATATQSFTLNITNNSLAPDFVSQNNDTETFGVPFTFIVNTEGYPVPKITKSGALPAGVTFTDNGDGTATIAGTPSKSAVGIYNLTFTAKNTQGKATQTFSLTITKAPVFKSTPAKDLKPTGNIPYSLTVTVTGYDTPSITENGTLPDGLNFVDNGDGTATISGTPAEASLGAYPFTLTATNSYGTANEALTINVVDAPNITSPDSATATVGTPFNFQVTTTGFPQPTISKHGTLPKGITFKASTGTFSGTPKAGSEGNYNLTIEAKNSQGITVIPFTITVN